MAIGDTTTKIAILKHLVDGKPLTQAAAFTRTTPEQARQVATAHGFPDPDKMRWAIDHLTESASASDLTSKAPVQLPAQRPAVVTAASAVAPPATRSDDTLALLNAAKAHPSKAVQAAADRVLDGIDKVKRLIAEDQEKHAERRKADAEKAAARAEVERLKERLAEAQAKLRGGKKKAAASSSERSDRLTRGEHPCRNDGCDRIFDTGQGRSMHERMKCAHRPAASGAA